MQLPSLGIGLGKEVGIASHCVLDGPAHLPMCADTRTVVVAEVSPEPPQRDLRGILAGTKRIRLRELLMRRVRRCTPRPVVDQLAESVAERVALRDRVVDVMAEFVEIDAAIVLKVGAEVDAPRAGVPPRVYPAFSVAGVSDALPFNDDDGRNLRWPCEPVGVRWRRVERDRENDKGNDTNAVDSGHTRTIAL
jgi:hypothetical protein